MTPKPSSPLCPHNDSFFTVGVQLLSYFQTSFKVIVLCELLRRETGREGGILNVMVLFGCFLMSCFCNVDLFLSHLSYGWIVSVEFNFHDLKKKKGKIKKNKNTLCPGKIAQFSPQLAHFIIL